MTSILVLALATAAAQGEADPAAIARAGLQSAKKFQDSPASWTVTHRTPAGLEFVVRVLKAGDRRRLVLLGGRAGQTVELARVIEKEGGWIVTEGTSTGKFRPYEAPLALATAYLYLTHSDALVLCDRAALAGWTLEGVERGVASFRSPLPESAREMLERTLAQWGSLKLPGAAKSKADLQDLLERGLVLKVDVRTGIVVDLATAQRRQTLSDLKWLERAEEKEFEAPEGPSTDLTGDPTAGDVNELVMIGHNGSWRPGFPRGELDARLFDLKSGALRRVPFRGAQSLPGCFLRDRKKVIVTGVTEESGLGLFEIDLHTGANRRLGGKLFESGFVFFPALSPDGKTLAVIHKSGTGKILEAEVALVDLASGAARVVGNPLDTAFLSWLPDGKGLVLVRREYADLSKRPTVTVSRMDLEGNLTPVIPGDMPLVLPDGKTILFRSREDDLWRTCDLAGKDVRLVADGLNGHGFPTPAPDGKRLLMIEFRAGEGPRPVLFDLGAGQRTALSVIPGLWGLPAWR